SPQPPKIHAFIRHASPTELSQFFSDIRYLHLLFSHSSQVLNLDELLLAILKNLIDQSILSKLYFKQFISTFSSLTGNDYRRLRFFLQRAQPLLTSLYL
ncbi:MAG TPA: hypothetical protein VHA52_12640, partial [Candidatus Babeliaceae bacterium]|nr:hypothetical protein [Candidatus Babeliaceae bacterium]